jgi:hypothetical protein
VESFEKNVAIQSDLQKILALHFQYSCWSPIYPCFTMECTIAQQQGEQDMPKFLALMLLRESSVFLSTLEDTEITEHNNDRQPSQANAGENIPVSEIIISAHVCLLVHALLYRSNVNKDINVGYLDEKNIFLQYLPRKSFWLLIRVLKAFFLLQEKTDVMLLDGVSPVLRVIDLMCKAELTSVHK